ncbi:hydroxymethylbilane synthase [Kitasatospora cheerisanensis]|uniref:Hydroxymethylbilane synthase n=1 Tax=Kitasatospora cheerisanensis KCTC 2395 TaxID=1348663 RepID=A0A066Z4D1_9ACTN|nr:hydroxymethylbilane synthase [Kitasatospora cheerisanensis]KDN87104.1 porphobilinogen deaminase [Kitasatospora cheerisanensis KCTC 2395]
MTTAEYPARTLRIGTRSSPLALAQVDMVIAALREHVPDLVPEVVPVTTEADLWQGDLAQLGGKGLYTKQIDAMLQAGAVDMAVHCVKDVPGDVPLPKGLVFAAYMERPDVRDVLLFPEGSEYRTLADLPPGAVILSSAVRRKAQILRARPDLKVVRVRGAIGSLLEKLDGVKKIDVHADGMILAVAGLARLGIERSGYVLGMDEMLPAVGAGVLGLECRQEDHATAALLEKINHPRTQREVTAERVLLHNLRGHCNSPIAAYCTTEADGQMSLRGMVFDREGSKFANAMMWDEHQGDPAVLGARVAAELLRQGAREIIAGIPH